MDYFKVFKDYLIQKIYTFFGYDYIYIDYYSNRFKMIEYTVTDEEIDKEIEMCTEEINRKRINDIEYKFFCLDMEERYNKLIKEEDENDSNNNNNNNNGAIKLKNKIMF